MGVKKGVVTRYFRLHFSNRYKMEMLTVLVVHYILIGIPNVINHPVLYKSQSIIALLHFIQNGPSALPSYKFGIR